MFDMRIVEVVEKAGSRSISCLPLVGRPWQEHTLPVVHTRTVALGARSAITTDTMQQLRGSLAGTTTQ